MAEIALALTVLCGAGLLGRSLMRAAGRESRVHSRTRRCRCASRCRSAAIADSNAQHTFHTRVIDGLQALPGTRAVGGTSFLPLAGVGPGHVILAGRSAAAGAERSAGGRRAAGDRGLFHGDGHSVARRPRRQRERHGRIVDPVAVINEIVRAADLPWRQPDRPASSSSISATSKPHEIIGVVGDVKLVSLDGEIRPTAYLSSRQYAFGIMTYVVRTDRRSGRASAPAAVRVIREIDPLLPVSAVRPLDEVFAESIARPRLTASAMSIFAGAALLLAALGVYGIVAYSVSQRVARIRHSRRARRASRRRSSAWSSARTCASSRWA